MNGYSFAEWLQQTAPDAAGPVAALMLAATTAMTFSHKRSFVDAAATTALGLLNPFFAISLLVDDPRFALTAAAALLAFHGAFGLAARRDDKGAVEFALLIAAGVALIGVEPALHAPLALLSLFLSPWRSSVRQLFGFWITLAMPSIMVVCAGLYLSWLSDAPISLAVPAISLSSDAANFFMLAAAPTVILGLALPGIAGGPRRAALFASAMLIALCVLAPPGAFVTLGAIATAAGAAWAARLGRSAALSLSAALVIGAGLVWIAFASPFTPNELANAVDAAVRTARGLH